MGLGTDGAASNNRLDLLEEWLWQRLLAKADQAIVGCLPRVPPFVWLRFEHATALGLSVAFVRCVPRKAADLVA